MIICLYIVSENTILIISRNIVQKFHSLLATTRQIYEIFSIFNSTIFWSMLEPIPIKEKTSATDNGWFVLGRIRVIYFVKQMVEFVATISPFHYPSEIYSYHIVKNHGVIQSVINHLKRYCHLLVSFSRYDHHYK